MAHARPPAVLSLGRGARVLSPLLSTILVACADAPAGPGDAAAPDLAPPGVSGEVAGQPLRLLGASVRGDPSCGPRGLAIVLEEAPGAAGAPSGCSPSDGGSQGAAGLRVVLSDRIPGVYLFTGPVTCLAPPGGKGLDATLRAAALPGLTGAVGGYVLLSAWDDRGARGFVDLAFEPSPTPTPAGRILGNFVAPPCP